ncbi:MAG: polyprenyl diphosphate synthase, partial [Microvirga sp.]
MSARTPELRTRPASAAPPNVPGHVAVIMDGNGRWASARGLPRVAGHRAGANAVRRCIEAAVATGVQWLTLYAFSSENWRRPADEVLDLTGLLRHYIRQELAEMSRQGVRVRIIGDRQRFDAATRAELDRAE